MLSRAPQHNGSSGVRFGRTPQNEPSVGSNAFCRSIDYVGQAAADAAFERAMENVVRRQNAARFRHLLANSAKS